MAGWRPIAEMQFDGFSYPALDQVISHIAKYRMRTRGRVGMPVVIRIPSFGGIKGKEHHGESPETYYAHTAGLKVVVPSDAARRLPAAAAVDRRSRSGDLPRAEEPVLVEGGRGAELTADGPPIGKAGVYAARGQGLHDRDLRRDARAVHGGGEDSRRGRDRASGGRPALARPARRRDARRRRARDGTGRGRPRGAADARDGRRDRGADHGGGVRPPRGAGRARDRPDVPYPPASLEERYLPSVERIADAVRRTVAY